MVHWIVYHWPSLALLTNMVHFWRLAATMAELWYGIFWLVELRKLYRHMCTRYVVLDGLAMVTRYVYSWIAHCLLTFIWFVCYLCALFQLISASTDNNVCIWDILSGDCEQKFRFPSPVLKVQFDPRNDSRCLVCPMRYAAVLVDINGTHKCLPLDSDVSSMRVPIFGSFLFIRIFFNWI